MTVPTENGCEWQYYDRASGMCMGAYDCMHRDGELKCRYYVGKASAPGSKKKAKVVEASPADETRDNLAPTRTRLPAQKPAPPKSASTSRIPVAAPPKPVSASRIPAAAPPKPVSAPRMPVPTPAKAEPIPPEPEPIPPEPEPVPLEPEPIPPEPAPVAAEPAPAPPEPEPAPPEPAPAPPEPEPAPPEPEPAPPEPEPAPPEPVPAGPTIQECFEGGKQYLKDGYCLADSCPHQTKVRLPVDAQKKELPKCVAHLIEGCCVDGSMDLFGEFPPCCLATGVAECPHQVAGMQDNIGGVVVFYCERYEA
jgi:hypothetical protein